MFFMLYSKFSNYVTALAISVFFLVFVAVFDTSCVLPNVKAAFKADYDIPNIQCFVQRKPEVERLMEFILLSSRHRWGGGIFCWKDSMGVGKVQFSNNRYCHLVCLVLHIYI